MNIYASPKWKGERGLYLSQMLYRNPWNLFKKESSLVKDNEFELYLIFSECLLYVILLHNITFGKLENDIV